MSAWRGFAMWLVAPALAFTAAGFVAGHAARVGLDEPTIGTKDYTIWPDGSTDLPVWRSSTDVLGGEIDLWIDGTLAEATTAPDLRVAIGTVEIWSDDTIAVDVVGRVHAGTILGPDGLERDSDGKWHRYRLGPDGPADMVIRAEVSIGDLRLHTLTNLDMTRPRPPQLATPDIPFVTAPVFTTPSAAGGVDIGSGLTMTADGTVIFPNLTGDPYEQVWMSPDGSLGGPVGDWPESNGVTTVYAADGSEYLVLPNQAIVTPDGTVIDVAALREAQAQENLPESETNPAVATSERVDDGAVSATTVAAMTATTTTNEQE